MPNKNHITLRLRRTGTGSPPCRYSGKMLSTWIALICFSCIAPIVATKLFIAFNSCERSSANYSQRAERVARTAETTRASIMESYVRVGAPTDRALRHAQADDSECAALRSYLVASFVGTLVDSATHRHALCARKEAKHVRVMENGLIARIDPASPLSNPGRPSPTSASTRLYVPTSLRPAYLRAFHDHLGHPRREREQPLL